MKTPARFKAETRYEKSTEQKANRNLPTMAAVGNGDGATVATGRANFYWIRLVNDDNRLTQCYSLVPLSYDDLIYVRRARDRDLSYYEFDKFIQGAGGTAPPTQVHDHSELIQGGDDLNPETISQRTLIVGVGCPYTTLRAAVAAVPGTPCTIKIMGITTAETGAITIPSDVTVEGHGRGSVIGMGANTLSLSSDSSLQDVAVTGSDTFVVGTNNATNVYLREVWVTVQANNARGFQFIGASAVRAVRCTVETTNTGVVGFYVGDTTAAVFRDCVSYNNPAIGLQMADDAVVATNEGRYSGTVDDINQGADATYTWINTVQRPGNLVLPGTLAFLPTIRETVGCALAHSANQAIPTGVWTALTFDTERWDDHQTFGGVGFHVGGNPTRITIPTGFDGRYTIAGHCVFDASGAGTQRALAIVINGVTTVGIQNCPFTAAVGTSISVATVYNLIATDFVELWAYQDTGGNLNVLTAANYSPEFRVERK